MCNDIVRYINIRDSRKHFVLLQKGIDKMVGNEKGQWRDQLLVSIDRDKYSLSEGNNQLIKENGDEDFPWRDPHSGSWSEISRESTKTDWYITIWK